jgi:acyl carrier protein
MRRSEVVDRSQITEIILSAMVSANLGRGAHEQLEVSPSATLFGPPSRLDSLGLVTLLIDIEDAFASVGHPIVLSDERALSERRSPYRSVPVLAEYIERLLSTPSV